MASSSVSARQRLERALEFLDPFDGRVRPLVRHRTEGSESLHLRAHVIMPPHETPFAPKCRSLGGDPPPFAREYLRWTRLEGAAQGHA